MIALAGWIVVAGVGLAVYTYAVYPSLLLLAAAWRPGRRAPPLTDWPMVSIVLPVYNAEEVVRATVENLLQLDYPADRREILVVSDASTDGTEAIVREFAGRGVGLLRVPRRGGKTAAENAALPLLRGEILVHTDASVHVDRRALKALVAAFSDPTVGVASSHNVSVARVDRHANYAESWYVAYDMGVRDLASRGPGFIGAAGCFYAARARLQAEALPAHVSPDFAAALVARERGFRTVSVRYAYCFVPRLPSLRREYHRKVRTITRGWQTLVWKRGLLNPWRYGAFAWILISHKICRWLLPHAGLLVLAALVALSGTVPAARAGVGAAALGAVCAALAWWWPERRRLPRLVAVPAYLVLGNLAALHASLRAAGGSSMPVWEPTRRDTARPLEVG